MHCFYYSTLEKIFGSPPVHLREATYERKPIITIGPDWKYVVAQILVINIIVSISISVLKKDSFAYHFNWCSLVVWNILLILMSLQDPGMSPRNPYIHTSQYLSRL